MNRRDAKRRLEKRGLFMVETYNSMSGVSSPDPLRVDGDRVLGVIDIPGDEVTLYLVAAPDADGAERVVLDRGLRPIRVVDVRWEVTPFRRPGARIRETPDVVGTQVRHGPCMRPRIAGTTATDTNRREPG